jgi:hypothetical protein
MLDWTPTFLTPIVLIKKREKSEMKKINIGSEERLNYE